MNDNQATPLRIPCVCGQTALEVAGRPIISVICACTSCRVAGQSFERAVGAPPVVRSDGGTDYCLYRKDRLRILPGSLLQEHRLSLHSKTHRVVARCCGAPMFLDFTPGHWVTVYRDRLPEERPPLELRTMAKDAPPGVNYSDATPTYPTHSAQFMARLLWAWCAMGFRRPRIVW